MDKELEWVVSELLPSIMPEFKAQIGKQKISILRIFSQLRSIKRNKYNLEEQKCGQEWLEKNTEVKVYENQIIN